MAAPVIESVSFNQGYSGSSTPLSFDVDKPTGTVEDDLLVAFCRSGNGSLREFDTPTGFTQAGSDFGDSNFQSQVFYKIAGASEPSAYTFEHIVGYGSGVVHLFRVSGGADHATIAFQMASVYFPNAIGVTLDCPSVTTTDDDSLLLRQISTHQYNLTYGYPSGHTNIIDEVSIQPAHGLCYKTAATAGSTGTAEFTQSPTYKGDIVLATLAIAPESGTTHNLSADDINVSPSVDSPALTQTHELSANSLASATSVDNPALTQTHTLTGNSLSLDTSVGNPALIQDHTLSAENIVSATTVGNPTLTQTHTLAGDNIASATSVGNPELSVTGTLNADNLTVTAALETPTLTQDHQLSANGLTVTTNVFSPVMTQDHTLSASNLVLATEVGNPTLSVDGTHYLNADNLVVSPSVGSPTLTMTHSLSADDLTIISIVGAPTLTQDHTLTVDGLTVAVQVGNPVLNGNVLKPKSYLVTGQNYSYKIIAENKLIKVIGYDL